MSDPAPLYPVSRRHLEVLTDDIGIMQHAVGSHPDPAHGYCTDDVARALQVDLLHARELGWTAVSASAERNMRFLEEAFDEDLGGFRNFRRSDGSWLPGVGSEDSQGRALLALGETMAEAPDRGVVDSATALFVAALGTAQELGAMRARASAMLGCHAAIQAGASDRVADTYRVLAGRLSWTFQSRPAQPWAWPEARLTYENALPVRALIVGGGFLGSGSMVDAGLRLLRWLSVAQTDPAGHLSPIGNGWWARGGRKAKYDQQPIEATALLLAAETAYLATNDDSYRATIERAYGWFLGANDLGQPVADPARGSSCDGVTSQGLNTNEGAESTLMWLMALEHVRQTRARQPIDTLSVARIPVALAR